MKTRNVVLGLFVPLAQVEGIEVEELPVEEIVLGSDPRLEPLSPYTRALIASRFGGDVDEAVEHARVHIHTHKVPESWARELVAPLPGWNDPFRRKVL